MGYETTLIPIGAKQIIPKLDTEDRRPNDGSA